MTKKLYLIFYFIFISTFSFAQLQSLESICYMADENPESQLAMLESENFKKEDKNFFMKVYPYDNKNNIYPFESFRIGINYVVYRTNIPDHISNISAQQNSIKDREILVSFVKNMTPKVIEVKAFNINKFQIQTPQPSHSKTIAQPLVQPQQARTQSDIPPANFRGETKTKPIIEANYQGTLNIKGSYFALLIAASKYQDPYYSPLFYPLEHVKQLKEVFVNNYGFEEGNVKVLENPDKREILNAMASYRSGIDNEDNLIIFFAGHGVWDQSKQIGYWLSVEAQKNNKKEWIENNEIIEAIKKIQSKHTLLISDACFGGSIFTVQHLEGGASKAIIERYNNRSRTALTSTYLSQVADNSPFITAFLEVLRENNQVYLQTYDIFSKIKDIVTNQGIKDQLPQYRPIPLTDDNGGDFIFHLQKK